MFNLKQVMLCDTEQFRKYRDQRVAKNGDSTFAFGVQG
jgi:hypothetical protein